MKISWCGLGGVFHLHLLYLFSSLLLHFYSAPYPSLDLKEKDTNISPC